MSEKIQKASHLMAINFHISFIEKGEAQEVGIAAKRIHYKHHSAWLCYLQDFTEDVKIKKTITTLRQKQGALTLTNKKLFAALAEKKNKLAEIEESLVTTHNQLTKNKDKLKLTEDALIISNEKQTVIEKELFATEEKFSNIDALLETANLQHNDTKYSLARQDLLLKTVFSLTVDAIALFDHEGHVITQNDAFIKLMASKPKKIIAQLADPNNDLIDGNELIVFEEHLSHKGKNLCYEIYKVPFKSIEYDKKEFIIIARDITLRKQIEGQLSASSYYDHARSPKIFSTKSRRRKTDSASDLLQQNMQYFLQEAITALSEAKKSGRNGICVYGKFEPAL